MDWSSGLKGAVVAVALVCFGLPPAEAIEIFDGSGVAAQTRDGLIAQVRTARGGATRPGGAQRPPAHRPGHRPGGPGHRPPAHRPPAHRPPVHRPPVHRPRPPVHRPPVGVRPPVWVGRPGWYRWPAGGAVAAGAALGFLSAAAAGSWAGRPPQAGLCWYYTDRTRRQGFWDVCP